MRVKIRNIAANALLAFVSIGVCLLALEGLARLELHLRGGGKERRERARYTESDERLGWRKRPGARVTYERREYTVEVVINSQGLRDPERGYQKPDWTHRILALGDSFVEAYSVPLEQSVTQVLEAQLSAPRCPIEVINGGTGGYSTDQEYLFYLNEGARYAPDIVLLFFFYNDLTGNTTPRYFGAPKPLLVATEEGLVQDNYPLPPLPKPSTEPLRRRRVEGSAAFHFAKERLKLGAPRTFNALAGLGLWEPLGGDRRLEKLRVFKRRRIPEIETAWEITDRILNALARAAEQAGTRFALVYIPSRMEVSDRDWELTRLRYEWNETWDRGLVAERIKKVGASGGFPVLDLTEALRAADAEMLGEPYFLHDGHWNARGHATAAAAIEAFLVERRWLPGCVHASK